MSYADELNLYSDPELVKEAQRLVAESGRSVKISIFYHQQPWPDNLRDDLMRWAELGVDRVAVNIGYDMNLAERVAEVAALKLD